MHHTQEHMLGPDIGLVIDCLHLLVNMSDGIGRSLCTSRSLLVLLLVVCTFFAIQQSQKQMEQVEKKLTASASWLIASAHEPPS